MAVDFETEENQIKELCKENIGDGRNVSQQYWNWYLVLNLTKQDYGKWKPNGYLGRSNTGDSRRFSAQWHSTLQNLSLFHMPADPPQESSLTKGKVGITQLKLYGLCLGRVW